MGRPFVEDNLIDCTSAKAIQLNCSKKLNQSS